MILHANGEYAGTNAPIRKSVLTQARSVFGKRWRTILLTAVLTTAVNYLVVPHYNYHVLAHGWVRVNTWTGTIQRFDWDQHAWITP